MSRLVVVDGRRDRVQEPFSQFEVGVSVLRVVLFRGQGAVSAEVSNFVSNRHGFSCRAAVRSQHYHKAGVVVRVADLESGDRQGGGACDVGE
ncbi:hypothetical protein [Phytohabitans flavus]|uniref:hypothetical protein n=1 Tax=Phytohabitans flavus TaxID=1076124 RepID=UPI0015645A25|nr:hypothetical protein [Phytohabitans flavus]